MSHTREMRHHGEAEIAFQKIADLGRAVARGAARAVRHRYKIGIDPLERRRQSAIDRH